MGSTRTRIHLAICVGAVALGTALALGPTPVRDRLGGGIAGLGSADPTLLWLAGAALILSHVCAGLAWRSVLASCGSRVARGDAIALYAVGSGLNAVAPAHVGGATRIALFSRAAGGEGAVWRVGGVAAAVAAVRGAWLAVVVAAAAVTGGVPAWPLALLAAGLAAAVLVAAGSRRLRAGARVSHLLAAFRGLGTRPRALVEVAGLTAAGMAVKLAAAGAAAAAVGIDDPVLAALVVVAAVELAAVLPLTPGNAGVASAAIAFALGATGTDSRVALSAGLAFGAIEILAALTAGLAGLLAVSGGVLRPRLRVAAAGASGTAACLALAVTIA